jgi:O-antigen ligase
MNANVQSVPPRIALLLAAMMALTPAMGSPREDLLQDTLKSMLVAFFALAAALVFFWQLRRHNFSLKLHAVVWLPVLLMCYALGSTMWSHAYLGSVEAARWFVFSLILLLGMNTFSAPTMTHLAWGIHLGAVMASLWAALQFWFDFRFFAQGPNPASTFVNRNFFAEFIVCALPFSVLLMTRLKDKASVFLITFSVGFNISALMMTGTRSAIFTLGLLLPTLMYVIFRYRRQFCSSDWLPGHWFSLAVIFFVSILLIGSLQTNNPVLRSESIYTTPIDRAFSRVASIASSSEYSHGSFSMRTQMWNATRLMVQDNPLFGIGAGAWEQQIPRYQTDRALETDYYAHNEFLQLIAEYGFAGWLFLFGIFYYVAIAVYRTCTDKSQKGLQEGPLRALALASLFALFLVSNAGFPWHLATTGALFSICLAILAASDLRMQRNGRTMNLYMRLNSLRCGLFMAILVVCSGAAILTSYRAVECEKMLVGAAKIAARITHSGSPNDVDWNPAKAQMLELTRRGVEINSHYRKLTPIVADALASWGDWSNAIWIWESVLVSRPYIVGMLDNVARGYLHLDNLVKAQEYLEKARTIDATNANLKTLEIMLWSRTGKEVEAADRARTMLHTGVVSQDLVQAAYSLGLRTGDLMLSVKALEVGIKTWPNRASDGWMRLGDLYISSALNDEEKAILSYRAAFESANIPYRPAVLARIPAKYRSKME